MQTDTPPSHPTAALSARDLEFAWTDGIPLWTRLSLDIPPGLSLIQGDEGSGKTTLLKLLSGELSPRQGSLTVGDIALAAQPEGYRQQVFRTDPRGAALDGFTPSAWFDAMSHQYPDFRLAALPDLVEGFSLRAHVHKPMYMLSTGSQRKVWLCAALAAGTTVTLLDEPFAALDMPSIRFLKQCLRDAGQHPTRAWVLADHEAPEGLAMASVIRV
jgi:ABC-type multidrug transport system ATPase subunit